MSYDLMVFQPEAAPANHQQFLDWYIKQTEWDEGESYDDPVVTTPQLRDLYMDLIKHFPPLNGPQATAELPEDEETATDYSVGKTVIYACFAWSRAGQAYKTLFQLAETHKLGFFDVSSGDQEVWLPQAGGLRVAHKKRNPGLLEKLRGTLFK